ncbi:MAG: DUF5808 domain-containing protein [Chloroflexota bacterium]|nr:DUF5808 domain-containing protein [Chloroflexota bacterium]
MSKKNKGVKPSDVLMGTIVATLVGSAVAQQLSRPANERTWHGKVVGIPYDFRMPTVEKLRNTFWNKDTASVLVPHAFGMGWSINFYPIVHPRPAQSLSEHTTH